MTVPEALRTLARLGWSQYQVGKHLDIEPISLSRYKNGRREPLYSTGDKIVRLAKDELGRVALHNEYRKMGFVSDEEA